MNLTSDVCEEIRSQTSWVDILGASDLVRVLARYAREMKEDPNWVYLPMDEAIKRTRLTPLMFVRARRPLLKLGLLQVSKDNAGRRYYRVDFDLLFKIWEGRNEEVEQ